MSTVLETMRAALAANDHTRARAALGELIREAPGLRGVAHHLALGAAAEELGEWKWAQTAYNLVLREDPGNPEALGRLAELAEEAGDLEGAAIRREAVAEARPRDDGNLVRLLGLYRRLGWKEQEERVGTALGALGVAVPGDPAAAPAATAAVEPEERTEERPLLERVVNPADADVARFASLFSGRENLYARQWFNPRKGISGYSPVEEPLTARVIRRHLFGDITVGVYPIRLDGTVVFMALDLDLTRAAMEWARRGRDEAAAVRRSLERAVELALAASRKAGLEPLVEDSGYKGRHLWFFFEQPERLGVVHALIRALVRSFEEEIPAGIGVETFPKQARRSGKGYGNLIKLPLGVHRRTGRRAWLLDEKGKPHPRPFELLRSVRRLGHAALMETAAALGETVSPGPAVAPWEGEPAAPGAEMPPGIEAPPDPGVQAPVPPAWTGADFETHPAIAHVLTHCPVLAEIVRRGVEDRALEHDEMIVLQQVFGHLPGGVAASNFVLERAVGIGTDRHLKSPLRGNPISCPKIRQRVPHITSRVACRCEFPDSVDHYPTPVLHLRTAPSGQPASARDGDREDLESLARRFLAQAALVETARRDLAGLETALAARLGAEGGALTVDGVALHVEVREGVARVAWQRTEEPKDGGST